MSRDPSGRTTSVEALDRMPLNDKLAHFARKDALRLPRKSGENWGAPVRLQRAGLPSELSPGGIDAVGGHVTRQAYFVIGRPCFGIPTARLIHGREHMIRKNGKLAFARCGECPIKAACVFIVDEMLHASEGIREARREFQRRGGAEAFWSSEPSNSRAPAAALMVLVRELQAAGFTTINDAAVAAHYDALAAKRRTADADRQRAYRRRAMDGPGKLDTSQVSQVIAEAKDLRTMIEAAQESPDCPRWLTRLAAADVARVWAVKVALLNRGQKAGATHIARAIRGITPEIPHDALRFRVARILKRERQIEALRSDRNMSPQ